MKKEHYEYVADRYNLYEYSNYNLFDDDISRAICSEIFARKTYSSSVYVISSCKRFDRGMIIRLPSLELAEEIVQFIKDTEILFV